MTPPPDTPPAERWLVTGHRGMLGSAVFERLRERGEVVAGADLPEVDLTDPAAAREVVAGAAPTHVIHCAAYTDVDGAESNPDGCRANVAMAGHLARACADTGARVLALSTDFVFDGRAEAPYPEDSPPNPINAYGRSKLEAEHALAEALPDAHQIVRTAWLYGPDGRNFVRTIHGRLRKGATVRVVSDQVGSPTYTRDLAPALVELARREETGVFHLVNAGQCSWFEFALGIARLMDLPAERVEPILHTEWPSPARRPAWSVLGCDRARALGLAPLRPWTEALANYLCLLESEA